MSIHCSSRVFGLAFAGAAALIAMGAAHASPVSYNFTANPTSGPLAGQSLAGSFSYDTSTINAGHTVAGAGSAILSDFSFTFMSRSFAGIDYDVTGIKFGSLTFGADGALVSFLFGTLPEHQAWPLGTNNWEIASGGSPQFRYSVTPPPRVPGQLGPGLGTVWSGTVSHEAVRGPVSVPEPAALAMFGAGVLFIGVFIGVRRRIS